jgi:UDP-glucose 4-epimerase
MSGASSSNPAQSSDWMRLYQNKRVVVVGGGGFIGTNLIRTLLDHSVEVIGYGHRPRFDDAIADARWVECDLHNGDDSHEILDGCDLVYYLAGNASPMDAERSVSQHASTNLIPAIRFFEHCAQLGVKRIVSVSSGGMVYGSGAPLPSKETTPTNPTNSYALTKIAVEQYLALFDQRTAMRGISLRVANPFGPYQLPRAGQGLIAAVLDRLHENRAVDIYGDDGTIRDYIYISDVIDAMLRAGVYEGDHGVFNIGSGVGRSVREVLNAIEQALDQQIEINHCPPRPVDIEASVLETTLANEQLSWVPKVSFQEGLIGAFEWMQSHHQLQRLSAPTVPSASTGGVA